MALGHERLDVYRLAMAYVAWVYEKAATLEGVHRAARDQWLRASQSIPLNIAEGDGKTADADRRRYFEVARGSASVPYKPTTSINNTLFVSHRGTACTEF
jgi:hypothetical protein